MSARNGASRNSESQNTKSQPRSVIELDAEAAAYAAYDASHLRDHDTLLVLGDSLTYFGPAGSLPPDDTRLWPANLADKLNCRLELFAQTGWTARNGWWAVTKDPRIWASVGHAKAAVIALGSMDSLPSPLPTALREGIRYLRPPQLRRAVRKSYSTLQPTLAPYCPWTALPPRLTAVYIDKIHHSISVIRPDIPIVGILPPTHNAESYGYSHPGRISTTRAIQEWAAKRRVPLVDLYELTHEFTEAGTGNPDGMHWGFDAHERVAEAFYEVLSPRMENVDN